MVDNRNKVKKFVKNNEYEPNEDKLTKDNAEWLPLLPPAIIIPFAFFINAISVHSSTSKTIFVISLIVSAIIISSTVLMWITGKRKTYGLTKAYFVIRIALSSFASFLSLCSLIFASCSEEGASVNDRKYIFFIITFVMLMTMTFFLSVFITNNMIKKDYFKSGNVGMLGAAIEALYVPLLITGKIIGKSDNSFLIFFVMSAAMSYIVFKATYYYLKIKYAVLYKMEDLLPQI